VLLVQPEAIALALMVVVRVTGIGPTYRVEEVFGVLPFVV
jgi:hypothetical protein